MSGAVRGHAYAKRQKYASGRVMWGAMYLVAVPDVYLSAGTFASKAEASAAAHAKLDEIRRGLLTDPRKGRMPFADFAAHFLDDLMTQQKGKTQLGYRQVIAGQLIPVFGRRRCTSCRPSRSPTG
jgi:hypothetical protein